MKGLKISGNRLISIVLSIVMCATILTGAIWALSNLFKTGMSIVVTYDAPINAKVYLSTDSSGAETAGLKQLKSEYSNITANNFVKENSALILNTHDKDNSEAKTKGEFEALGKDESSLICDPSGEMEFYVYVENYSETEIIFCNADVTFTEANGSEPFTVSNPMSITGTAVGEDNPSKSLLTFKIKSTNATGLNANTIRIEIDMNSFAVSSLQESSWATINLISEAGWASQFFSVGDEKNVSIGGVDYTFQIWGFDHDDKSDGSGTAGITFGMKDLLANTYQMNSTDTNSGGWNDSEMRTRMSNFFGQLDTDLQSAIKTVNKEATKGGGSSDTQTSEDKLFLFSEREIDGTTTAGYVDEGTQYTYWVGKEKADRIKKRLGSADYWWLRSPNRSNNDNFRYFRSSGDIYSGDADNAYGVCFGFCV